MLYYVIIKFNINLLRGDFFFHEETKTADWAVGTTSKLDGVTEKYAVVAKSVPVLIQSNSSMFTIPSVHFGIMPTIVVKYGI